MCIFEDARNWVRRFWQHCTLPEKKFLVVWTLQLSPEGMTEPDFRFSFFKGGRLAALDLDLEQGNGWPLG